MRLATGTTEIQVNVLSLDERVYVSRGLVDLEKKYGAFTLYLHSECHKREQRDDTPFEGCWPFHRVFGIAIGVEVDDIGAAVQDARLIV
jgi:hypothetical protein